MERNSQEVHQNISVSRRFFLGGGIALQWSLFNSLLGLAYTFIIILGCIEEYKEAKFPKHWLKKTSSLVPGEHP